MRLSVTHLGALFERLDPAPPAERDLDAHAEQFLVSWARSLPAEAPLRLSIEVHHTPSEPGAARAVQQAVRNHFLAMARLSRIELRALLQEGRIALLIGLSFLACCVTAASTVVQLLPPNPWTDVLRETLTIGGWVAMWRPLQIYLYDWWPLKSREHLYRRMARTKVRLRCRTASPTDAPAARSSVTALTEINASVPAA